MSNMSDATMFSIRAAEGHPNIGEVFSSDEAVLRSFGAAYMRDQTTTGHVALYAPDGTHITAFDPFQDKWEDADATAA